MLKKIRAAGKLCQVTVSPEGAVAIIRELGGKGFAFVIDELQLTPSEGQAFLEELEKGLILSGRQSNWQPDR